MVNRHQIRSIEHLNDPTAIVISFYDGRAVVGHFADVAPASTRSARNRAPGTLITFEYGPRDRGISGRRRKTQGGLAAWDNQINRAGPDGETGIAVVQELAGGRAAWVDLYTHTNVVTDLTNPEPTGDWNQDRLNAAISTLGRPGTRERLEARTITTASALLNETQAHLTDLNERIDELTRQRDTCLGHLDELTAALAEGTINAGVLTRTRTLLDGALGLHPDSN